MKEYQEFLEILTKAGYATKEIATKLTALGAKFTIENGKIVLAADEEATGQESLSILSCLSDIVENTTIGGFGRKLNPKLKSICSRQIKYVCEMIGINTNQAILLANIIEGKGHNKFDMHNLADVMGMSYIKLLSFENDIKDLNEKRLINLVKDAIYVGKNTISALASNKPYSIPKHNGLNTIEILKEMNEIISAKADGEMEFNRMLDDLDALFLNNPEAGIVKAIKELGLDISCLYYADRALLYVLIQKYIYEDDDRVGWADFSFILDDASHVRFFRSRFSDERFELQRKHIVEPINEDGLASPENFHITDSAKEQLFEEVGLNKNKKVRTALKITRADKIRKRELFYNKTEGMQVRRLASLLIQEKYKSVVERLNGAGMRTGFNCLFYGSPGTGKTESVYQLALATGRDLIQINVNDIKSCWIGESEKNIADVFASYRAIVKESKVAPILLFNEADAIFGIRKERADSAAEKLENGIQNIILQEMEKLDGILIATTNLSQNLDKAFERRFLYKVKFCKPDLTPRTMIWKSMIPDLTDVEAMELAEEYDFSGGQIENIARKRMVDYALDGTKPSLPEIKEYCSEELIEGNKAMSRKIGF